ncbi:MAG: alkaline phosphatase D family protein [Saprospiraceae bacterium]
MQKTGFWVLFAIFLAPLLLHAQQPKTTPRETPENTPADAPDLELYRPRPLDTTKSLSVIAFGSCNKLRFPQTLFNDIAVNSPNLWVWLGDIVYADTTDLRALATEFKKLKTAPEYQNLLKKTPAIGIWDDHDYGMNDGDKNHPTKQGAKRILMDFLDVAKDSPARKREGAYQSYTFGKAPQTIKIILLDTRYFRDPLESDPTKVKRYLPNTEGDILGEAQWRWLEKELKNSKANLNIIGSSIQILSDEQPFEKWANFPAARKRLINLIVKTQPKNALFLSGDRHMAEISRMDVIGLPYPLYDFTSSGMTHTRPNDNEPNKYRQGEMVVRKNFGLLQIAWINDRPIVTMQVRGPRNELFKQEVVKY